MSYYQDECDRLWQVCMQLIWKGRCAKCGSQYGCSGHHIVKRRFQRVRYSMVNGILLCIRCHNWMEEHPIDGMKWLAEHHPVLVPPERQPELLERSTEEWKQQKRDLQEQYKRLLSESMKR